MVFRVPIWHCTIVLGIIFCAFSFVEEFSFSKMQIMEYDDPYAVLIIDPGHGGYDGGASTSDGVKESEINLAISLKLNTICHLYGIPTVMTRNSETIDYPSDATTIAQCKKADQEQRLRLIRDYPYGILFSIHQNYYPAPQPSGVQVLYGHDEKSCQLGQILQTNLCRGLCPDCRRLASEVDEDIYLMKHCGSVSALIECGFLSNIYESKQLQNNAYQLKIATILLSSYMEYITQNQK